MSRFSFDFLRLEKMRAQSAGGNQPGKGANPAEMRALAKSMLDRMDEAKDISLSENHRRHDKYVADWRALAGPAKTE